MEDCKIFEKEFGQIQCHRERQRQVERTSIAIWQSESWVRVGRRVVKFEEDIFEESGTLGISLVEVPSNKPKIVGPTSGTL